MPATWSFSERIDASPDAVWAWMTDFTEDDHASEAFRRGAGVKGKPRASKRTILSREGNVLRIEDKDGSSTYRQTVTLHPAERRLHIEGQMGYDAWWSAMPDGDGTRLSVDGKMGSGVVGALMRVFQGAFRKGMERDFRGHVEDLRESVKPGSR